MENRLNRSDYIFSLVLVFMLVCVAGAFFFGVEIGKKRMEAQYAQMLAKNEEAEKKPGAYEQQHLVSYYHSVYAPYREFLDRWFDKLAELQLKSSYVDASAVLKDLAKTAGETYDRIAGTTTPETSPLLGQAHQNVLKSLKLFADTLDKYRSKGNAMHPGVLAAELDKDSSLLEAKQFALQAQQQYYLAIVKWNETVEHPVKGAELLSKSAFTLKEWSEMSLNVKNSAVSNIMLGAKRFTPLYPQDMTVRVDEMIANGQAKKLNLNDVQAIVDFLIDTHAARKGDFIQWKDKWYGGETIPQLPFFYEPK